MNSKKSMVFFHIIIFICLVLLAGSVALPGAFAASAYPGAYGLSPYGFQGGGFGVSPGFGVGFGYGAFGFGGGFNPGFNTGFGYGAYGFNPGFGTGFNYGTQGFGGYNPGLGYGASAFGGAFNTGFNYGAQGLGGFNPGLGYGASTFGSTFNPGFNSGFGYGASGLGFGTPSYGFGGTFGGYSPVGFGATMPYNSGFRTAMGGLGIPLYGMQGGFAGGIPGFSTFQPNIYGAIPFATTQTSKKKQETKEPENAQYYEEVDDIPDLRGHWAGNWETFATDPNGKILSDPNGVALIAVQGDIKFHITTQIMTGGKVEGTAQINNWDVEEYPTWDGHILPVNLTGWIDKYNRWLLLHYFNIDGDTLLSDLSNLISDYTWMLSNLRIYENWFLGQFTVRGTNNYLMVGTFKVTRYTPE